MPILDFNIKCLQICYFHHFSFQFVNYDGVCCPEGHVNQNGNCQDDCDEGYENINGNCARCAKNFKPLKNFYKPGTICCKEGFVNLNGECEDSCQSNPNYEEKDGVCVCKEGEIVNYNGICCTEGQVIEDGDCSDGCNPGREATNGICHNKPNLPR